jgi:serine/threonine protein kinase
MSQKPGLENYKIIKPLGAGSFGKVKRNNYLVAVHIPTCAKVAIKFIQRSSTSDISNDSKIKREIKILKKFHHPNIIRL